MADIHPTAVVSPDAELGSGVKVGPYCIVGQDVRIGERTQLLAHVYMDGHTTVGADCLFYPFTSVGTRTQDLKYRGGTPMLKIGDRTTVRESVTLNVATKDGDATVVGSDCLLMAYAHVAHDCQLGNGVILANCGTLAGHVVMEDFAILGGLSGVHQFVRIGCQVMIGGCCKVTQDVPPFMIADGNPLAVRGINSVGLKRRGKNADTIRLLKAAYKILYRESVPLKEAASRIESELDETPERQDLLNFLNQSERGIARG